MSDYYSNIIVHAGGAIDNITYTNSLESITSNVKNYNKNVITLCELDCCKLLDEYIIAHDGTEYLYNLNKSFNLTTISEALKLKNQKKYTPLFFSDLYNFISNNNYVNFIIDSNHDLSDDFINYVMIQMKEFKDNIIFQVYKIEDILLVEKYKWKCLYALWKCNPDAYNDQIKSNLNYIEINNIKCIGVSLFNFHYNEKEISMEMSNQIDNLLSHKYKVYLHGENSIDKCNMYLYNNLGIFTHNPYYYLEYSLSKDCNSEIIQKLLNEMFAEKDKYFLNSTGITGCKVNLYNEMIHCTAVIFFKILDHFNLDYYVFAGSAIGLCRDGNNIPWVDDYDIIIFEDQIELFENTILPFLKYIYNFNANLHSSNKSGYKITKYINDTSFFMCDVFYSYISKEGYVKNKNIEEPWGLYDFKNIPVEIVKPKNYCLFNGINLPFFNDYKKDIEIEYGDIYNNCVIHINHGITIIQIPYNFMEVYDEFSNIKNIAIENTRMLIESNKYLIQKLEEAICHVILFDKFIIVKEENYFVNILKVLTFLNNNKLENITLPIHLLKYVCDIKFYFPKIKINVWCWNIWYYKYINISRVQVKENEDGNQNWRNNSHR